VSGVAQANQQLLMSKYMNDGDDEDDNNDIDSEDGR
jgi:hypothetical protein